MREKISANLYGKRSTEVVYLLRHKLKCGYCGKPISAECGTAKNGEKKRYYKCLGRKNASGCKKSMVRKNFLEDFVTDNIIDELSKPVVLDNLVKSLLKVQETQMRESSSVNLIAREKKQTETAIQNMLSAIEKGVVTNTTTKRLKELEDKLEYLERSLLIERSKNSVILSEDEMRQFYREALSLERQMLINYLIKEITLYDDKMEIRYNSPLKTTPGPDESRGFSFNSITAKIPYIIQNMKKLQKCDMQFIMTV